MLLGVLGWPFRPSAKIFIINIPLRVHVPNLYIYIYILAAQSPYVAST